MLKSEGLAATGDLLVIGRNAPEDGGEKTTPDPAESAPPIVDPEAIEERLEKATRGIRLRGRLTTGALPNIDGQINEPHGADGDEGPPRRAAA